MNVRARLAVSANVVCAAVFYLPPSIAIDSPEGLVRALYAAHQPWKHKQLDLGNRTVLAKYFSAELTTLFLRNDRLEKECPSGYICGIDFDPITGAQDFDDNLHFKLRVVPSAQSNIYEAHFKLFNDSKTEQIVEFKLIQSAGAWRIDDIIYPDVKTSIRAVIDALR